MLCMNFPLQLRFKTFAIAPQIVVTNATGALVLYVRQQAFKLKEAVNVYADAAKTRLLYTIAADRVWDFNAQYHVTNTQGARLGSVRRRGMRSLWTAHYEIEREGRVVFSIREENPWTKVLDGFFGQIPVLGLLAAYLFHPAYLVAPEGSVCGCGIADYRSLSLSGAGNVLSQALRKTTCRHRPTSCLQPTNNTWRKSCGDDSH